MSGRNTAKLLVLLWIFIKWEWKIAKFTGAWVFVVPIAVSAIVGPAPIVYMLAFLCTVFCVGYTIRSVIRRQANKQAALNSAPVPQVEQNMGGIFFGSQE